MTYNDGDYVAISTNGDEEVARLIYQDGQWYFQSIDSRHSFGIENMQKFVQHIQMLNAQNGKAN